MEKLFKSTSLFERGEKVEFRRRGGAGEVDEGGEEEAEAGAGRGERPREGEEE